MGIDYIVAPVTRELLSWGHKCGVPVPHDTPLGRYPTMAEMARVLDSLDGYSYELEDVDGSYHGTVQSLETIDFLFRHPDPDMDAALGGIRTAPKEYANLSTLKDNRGTRFLSFHGNLDLIVRVAMLLTADCGPLVAFANIDGIPAFMLPGESQPIWKEAWF